jgi:hypothetical protein
VKLYDYEVDSYLGVEPSSISDLMMRSNLLRKNLEERSAKGWRFISSVSMGKSSTLVFEREARDLEWSKVEVDWAEDAAAASRVYDGRLGDGWFEHSRSGTMVTFFRKKKVS